MCQAASSERLLTKHPISKRCQRNQLYSFMSIGKEIKFRRVGVWKFPYIGSKVFLNSALHVKQQIAHIELMNRFILLLIAMHTAHISGSAVERLSVKRYNRRWQSIYPQANDRRLS